MSANLLDSLKEYITPELISQASGMLGESEGGISKAISSALPSLLGGVLSKTDDSTTMDGIMDLIKKAPSDSGGILSNLGGLLSANDSSVSQLGSSLLNMVFGSKLSGVTDLVASTAGIKSASASSVLGMVAPLLIGHLGKSGMSLSGLTNMLFSQKDSILAAAPTGLSSLVHLSGIGDKMSVDTSGNKPYVSVNKSEGGFPKWLLPLLLIIGGILALYYFTKGCNKHEMEGASDGVEVVDSVANDMSDEASAGLDSVASEVSEATTALGKFFKFKLPNGIELNAPELGIENKLVTWLNDKTKVVDKTTWFNFDRLLFETGKSILKPESQEQLKNIAEVMKAYPSVAIKIGGYTDNVGNPASNLKLSGARANAVMAELVKLGVGATRMEAEGYGDQHPVASNDTEEGRAQNRRIAVRVTKK